MAVVTRLATSWPMRVLGIAVLGVLGGVLGGFVGMTEFGVIVGVVFGICLSIAASAALNRREAHDVAHHGEDEHPHRSHRRSKKRRSHK
jgi:hypothetical protein